MLSDELQTENALNGFRGATNRGCPFWLQRSYRWRMIFLVSEELQRMPFLALEELQTEGALSRFREVTDGECP
jgi:hypothetical protein